MFGQKTNKNKILLGQDNNALMWIFGINFSVFVMVMFIKVALLMTDGNKDVSLNSYYTVFLYNFVQSSNATTFLHKPWTALTYMFLHDDIWNLISTSLWCWFFGYIMQDLSGNKRIFPLYIYGGVVGALAYVAASHWFPTGSDYLGEGYMASGSNAVMCLAIATCSLAPNYRLFVNLNGGIRLWIIAVLYVILDLSSLINGNIAIGIAHIVSGLFGLGYTLLLKKGTDLADFIIRFWDWISNVFNPEKPARGKSHLKVVSRNEELYYSASRTPFVKKANSDEEYLNAILDKINEKGMNALTPEEKLFLTQRSEK